MPCSLLACPVHAAHDRVPRTEAGLPDWNRLLSRLATEIESQTGTLRERAGLPPRAPRSLRIATYRGYAHGPDAFLANARPPHL